MQASDPVEIQLVGGELDGDTFVLTAKGSVDVPHQLSYLGVKKEEACWLIYACDFNDITDGWPVDGEVKRQYHYSGAYSLDYSRKLA